MFIVDWRIFFVILWVGLICKEDVRDVRRCCRDFLCIVDFIVLEVVGSWVIIMFVLDYGEFDFFSVECDCVKEECWRISDDGVEYVVS